MASVGDPSYLWSPDNKDGQTIVSEHASYHDLLVNNLTNIVKLLELSDSFWALLKECGVVDENIKTKVQKKKTRQTQGLILLDHIINSEVYKFHGFAWAIVNTKQYNLAKKLGFELSVYFNATLLLKSSSFLCPSCCEFYTKAYILPECGHYVCSPCVKGAQFLCKDNLKEDITCPVPDCGKVSQTNAKLGSGIGLEEDERYAKLCQLVQNKTEELQKKKGSEVEVKDNNNSALDVAVKQTKHYLSTYEQTYRTYLDTISHAEPRLKAYLEKMCNKVINWIKQWHSEKEEFLHQSKFQVQTRHAQSVQWVKMLDDLMIISHICPSEVVETASFTLAGATPDVLDYLEQLVSGTVIPKNIRLPQNINVDAATKHPKATDTANYLFQWKNYYGTLLDVDWISGGHIVTCTSQHFVKLTLDLESQSIVYSHQQQEDNITSVSTSVDDMIYLCGNKNVKIFNPCMMCWETWPPSVGDGPYIHGAFATACRVNRQKIFKDQTILTGVAGGHKYFVSGNSNDSVNIYDRQRKLLYDFRVCALGNICICENTLVAIGNGIHLINLDTKKQLLVPVCREGEGRLVSPFDVAPFGEDHFLVYDQALQDFKVFNLAGEFILKLKVDKRIKQVTLGQNQPRHIATFPKKGTPTHLAVASNQMLWIFSLTYF